MNENSVTDIWYLEGYVTIISEDTNIFADADGALVMVNMTEDELPGDMTMFEEPITISENTEISDVKLMIWDKNINKGAYEYAGIYDFNA